VWVTAAPRRRRDNGAAYLTSLKCVGRTLLRTHEPFSKDSLSARGRRAGNSPARPLPGPLSPHPPFAGSLRCAAASFLRVSSRQPASAHAPLVRLGLDLFVLLRQAAKPQAQCFLLLQLLLISPLASCARPPSSLLLLLFLLVCFVRAAPTSLSSRRLLPTLCARYPRCVAPSPPCANSRSHAHCVPCKEGPSHHSASATT